MLDPTLLLASAALAALLAPDVPEGYVDETFLEGLEGPVGIVPFAEGHAFVWEREGRVYLVHEGELEQPPVLDLSDEVGSWRDFGMLGFVLDPGFLQNGDVYCLYVVDRHHLLYYGTPDYDPTANQYLQATIGRVTRFTLDPSSDFTELVPGSRTVLVGESIDAGIPILHQSHGVGSLVFGADGTLLVSVGDAASYDVVDHGSAGGTYWQVALADGIIRPAENVGAFRAQMIGSLNGKILRLDPATGDGVPSNPFYDAAAPRAPRSRVWALGLRNPFRFSVRPGTGHPDPAAGDPGVLYVGDVGWEKRESLFVVQEPGVNLGWPLFEGLAVRQSYWNVPTENLDAPNPLQAQGVCDHPFFTFQELLAEEQADHHPSFPNPCDPAVEIAPSTPTFMHHRPVLDWRHGPAVARVPTFDDEGNATFSKLGDPDCPVAGDPFNGFCSVGGGWLGETGFGDHAGTYLLMDFSAGWMRSLRFDGDDRLESVDALGSVPAPVFATEDPGDGSVLYVTLGGRVQRIRWLGSGNVAPQPVLAKSAGHGPSPLDVRFDASGSSDPEGGALAFHWDFGDGGSSAEPSPLHRFQNPGGTPATRAVELVVTDAEGAASNRGSTVWLDDTPPVVAITSFANGATYSTSEPTTLVLEADASDVESTPDDLAYAWQVFLRHDHHEHPESILAERAPTVVLPPTPCTGSYYAYRVELTVTDPQGLATKVAHWLVPDCELATTVAITAPSASERLLPGRPTTLAAEVTGAAERVDFHVDGEGVGTVLDPPYVWTWTPEQPGTYLVSALAHTPSGAPATSPGAPVLVQTPVRLEVAPTSARDEAVELGNGRVVPSAGELVLGSLRTYGVRVPLDVPQGAAIVHAWLEWTVSTPTAAPTRLVVRAEAADDAPPFAFVHRDLSTRPTTTAAATFDVAPWVYSLASGARQRSADLRDVLEEVVDRPGFESGDALLLLVTGRGERRAFGVKPPSGREVRLVVEYDEGE